MFRNLAIAIILIMLIYFKAHAAYDLFIIGANSSALGHATVMRYDIWSAFHNQAGLAQLQGINVGFHHESRFFLKEMGIQAFAFALPTSSGTFATTFVNYGYTKYFERKIGLAYAKTFGERFSAGLQFDYIHTYIAEYDESDIFTFEAGIISEPVDNFFIGAHLFNPAHTLINAPYPESMPVIFRLGAGYNMNDRVYLSIEAEKEMEEKIRIKSGLEWQIINNIFFRTGISSQPLNTSFGLGYKYKRLCTDIAFTCHPVLGHTPHFSISYGL